MFIYFAYYLASKKFSIGIKQKVSITFSSLEIFFKVFQNFYRDSSCKLLIVPILYPSLVIKVFFIILRGTVSYPYQYPYGHFRKLYNYCFWKLSQIQYTFETVIVFNLIVYYYIEICKKYGTYSNTKCSGKNFHALIFLFILYSKVRAFIDNIILIIRSHSYYRLVWKIFTVIALIFFLQI